MCERPAWLLEKCARRGASQAQQENLNPDPNIKAFKHVANLPQVSDLGAGITKKSIMVENATL